MALRISSKGRYALASLISMAQNYDSGEYTTVISISEKLGISKIYLEQVFSLLKRAGLVNSVKGAQGGYILTTIPQQITVYDIMKAVELSLFESTEETVAETEPEIEKAMRVLAFDKLDEAVKVTLQKTTLYDLVAEAERQKTEGYMYYI